MSHYMRIEQLPYCCVPASLLMVLHRRGLPAPSQAELGYQLGLTVPADMQQLFPRTHNLEAGPAGYGTQLQRPEFSLNAALERLNIPLQCRFIWGAELTTPAALAETLTALVGRSSPDAVSDVLACFDVQVLNDGATTRSGLGHVAVVAGFDAAAQEITLIDPSPRSSGWRQVGLAQLQQAMALHGTAAMGGLWVLEPRTEG